MEEAWEVDSEEDTENAMVQASMETYSFPLTGPAGEKLISPCCIAVSRTGEFLICDPISYFLVIYNKNGDFLSHFSTLPVKSFYVFLNMDVYQPHDVGWLSTKKVVFTQPAGCKICISDWKGNVTTCIQGRPLYEPYGLAVDDTDKIFVTDRKKGRILCYSAEGKLLQSIGSFSSSTNVLSSPLSIAIDHISNLVIGDFNKGRMIMHIYKRNGDVLESITINDAPVSEERYPHITVTQTGYILLADTVSGSVLVLSADKLNGEESRRKSEIKLAEKLSGITYIPDKRQLAYIDQSHMSVYVQPWQPASEMNGYITPGNETPNLNLKD
ncbi:hypothetical protein ACJMK2_015438 [Sinanodonta woodiana]|uniref:Uncharacterized protein n=1 Tax=Sinanodonta woodiana TaxID=1069815 RepID=A0ABD3URP7_SINWO